MRIEAVLWIGDGVSGEDWPARAVEVGAHPTDGSPRDPRTLRAGEILPGGISSWYVRAPRARTRWPGFRRAAPELEVPRVERALVDAQRPRHLSAADDDVGKIGRCHPEAGRELGVDLGVLRPEPGFTPLNHH
jgi:hypothetical protein